MLKVVGGKEHPLNAFKTKAENSIILEIKLVYSKVYENVLFGSLCSQSRAFIPQQEIF